jgi:D-alanyl-D-alanine carboxypeptidase
MKNFDYSNVLMYISLFLAFAILFSLIYGCTFRKYRRPFFREHFETEAPDSKQVEEKPETKNEPKSTDEKPYEASLTKAEKDLKEKIKSGKLDENDLMKMYDNKQLTETTVKNIIESFENEIKYKSQ